MLIAGGGVLRRNPAREAGKVLKHFVGIGVEKVWAVFMNEDAVLVDVVVGVAANVVSLVDDHATFADARQTLGHYHACEACTHD